MRPPSCRWLGNSKAHIHLVVEPIFRDDVTGLVGTPGLRGRGKREPDTLGDLWPLQFPLPRLRTL